MLLLNYRGCFYILIINLSGMWFTNIFWKFSRLLFYSVGCFLWCRKNLKFDVVSFVYFLLLLPGNREFYIMNVTRPWEWHPITCNTFCWLKASRRSCPHSAERIMGRGHLEVCVHLKGSKSLLIIQQILRSGSCQPSCLGEMFKKIWCSPCPPGTYSSTLQALTVPVMIGRESACWRKKTEQSELRGRYTVSHPFREKYDLPSPRSPPFLPFWNHVQGEDSTHGSRLNSS